MAQITEDYVSFETAKLLKEKGFNEYCKSVYHVGSVCSVASLGYHNNEGYGEVIDEKQNSDFGKYDNAISAPTLQMAMKWLWEKHKKHVEPAMTIERLGFTFLNKWHCFVMSVDNKNQTDLKCVGEDFSSYEEACEFGIKYCLKMIFV